jgi:biotin synthase
MGQSPARHRRINCRVEEEQMNIGGIAEKIIHEGENAVEYDEACELASLPEGDTVDILHCAGKIMRGYKKKLILCSIINAKSGFCSEDCAFCAQSSHHNTRIDTYELLKKEKIVEQALRMDEAGATRYSMVTSGFALSDEEIDTICNAAKTIRDEANLTVCTSPGTVTEATARRLKGSGISVYHHNLETARSYFDKICTTHSYDEDIQAVRTARAAGLKVCSGGILGLGETWEQRVELAFTLRELDVDGIPLNFLNPIPGTRMEHMSLLPPAEALKCVALFRLVNPGKEIIICGGREVVLKDFQSWIFFAGANGLMIGNYLTTQGRNITMDMEMIKDSRLWLL